MLMGFKLIMSQYLDDLSLLLLTWLVRKGQLMAFIGLKGICLDLKGFVFLRNPLGNFFVREGHRGDLARHFGEKKTLVLVKEHFYWLGMIRDVYCVIER